MIQKQRRYQNGTIEEIRTRRGMCWYIRFSNPDGSRPRSRVGLRAQYPTKALADRAASYLRDDFNGSVNTEPTRTFGDVIVRYGKEEIPERYSTRCGYERMIRVHISPRWADTRLSDLDPIEVRSWLRNLKLASRTKGHIRDLMRLMFKFAIFWRWSQAQINPLSTFTIPGVSKRTRKPRIVTPEQFHKLLESIVDHRVRIMVAAAYLMGFRVSELFALKWKDFDERGDRVYVSRAVVDGHVGLVKTAHSAAALPLPKMIAEGFSKLRASSLYNGGDDWVFPDHKSRGRSPSKQAKVQREILRPASQLLGLDFNLGWHSLRHSYKVLVELAGAEITVQRDLMRHADVTTTLQIYGEVQFYRMRDANEKAVQLAMAGQISAKTDHL